MPSMLGLTKDPSPHGIQNGGQSKSNSSGSWGDDNSKGNWQLAQQGNSSIIPGIQGSSFFNKGNEQQQQEDEEESDEDEDNTQTIKGRNTAAAKENETLLWRALCDKPKSAKKYIAKDAIISNRFLFGDAKPRSADSDPTLEESLKDCEKWLAYKIHSPQAVEIDLMAAALAYRVTLFRQVDQGRGKSGMETVDAIVSSSWRQVASGDWELCSMMAS